MLTLVNLFLLVFHLDGLVFHLDRLVFHLDGLVFDNRDGDMSMDSFMGIYLLLVMSNLGWFLGGLFMSRNTMENWLVNHSFLDTF